MTAMRSTPRECRKRLLRCCAIVAMALGLPAHAFANAPPDPSVICDQVAQLAAQQTGVPISVLKAISLTETGRKHGRRFRPWPWTVNMEGAGHWFDTRAEAKAYVDKEFARGARSFDIGCFQINYKWHGDAFRSIDEMFDPLPNALYAARFLQQLRAEQGSWGKAAGAYHSRTKQYADGYQARFERIREPLLAQDGQNIPDIPDIVLAANGVAEPSAPAAPRVNRYPLLQTGGAVALGSLVPLGGQSANPLFAAPVAASVIE
jgi:hypothetical protein